MRAPICLALLLLPVTASPAPVRLKHPMASAAECSTAMRMGWVTPVTPARGSRIPWRDVRSFGTEDFASAPFPVAEVPLGSLDVRLTWEECD